ncbi:hypothetical protein ACF0H5_020716 [Mactra antiquata]
MACRIKHIAIRMWMTRLTLYVPCCIIYCLQLSTLLVADDASPPSHCLHRNRTIDCRNKNINATFSFRISNVDYYNVLDLGENNLNSIPRAAFASLSNLTTLLLDSNRISSIDISAFDGVTSLVDINLANNRLVKTPAALCSLKKLQDLNITGNPITPARLDSICEKPFIGTVLMTLGKCLTSFSFGKEGLINQWPNALRHLNDLRKLHVTGLDVPVTSLIRFHDYRLTLKSLTFENSNLTELPSNIAELTELEELHIDHNKYNFSLEHTIEFIVDTVKVLSFKYDGKTSFSSKIRFPSHLQNLSLEGNNIKVLTDEFIQTLIPTNISVLSLKNCDLRRVPASLSDVKTIKYVDLSNNKIVTIEAHDLTYLPNLLNLTLAFNPLKHISFNAFIGINSLRFVDLSNTDVTFISKGLANLRSLEYLDLTNTGMECTCDMVWVRLWFDENEMIGQHVTVKGACTTIDRYIDDYINRRLPTCPEYIFKTSGIR